MKTKSLVVSVCFMLFAGLSLGQVWDFNKRLTFNSGLSKGIQSAVDSGNGLHVVWSDSTPGNDEIFWKMGLLGGTGIWTVPKRLTNNSGFSGNPSICINKDDDIHIVWEDYTPGNYEIYHKFSTDNGNTWSLPKRVTWTAGSSWYPHISNDGAGRINLFYCDDSTGDHEIYYKQFNPSTKTWGSLKRLTYTTGDAWIPWGAVVNGDVHVVWQDDSRGNFELYHKISSNNGSTWSSSKRITYNSGQSKRPRFVGFTPSGTTDPYLHLVWFDNTSGDFEIYYKKWSAATGTWQGLKRLTWTPTHTMWPTIAIDSNYDLHVVYTFYNPTKNDLFHKKSLDNGANWSSVTRLTWSSGDTYPPHLVISPLNDDLLLVYSRFVTSENPECFFKRGSQGGV